MELLRETLDQKSIYMGGILSLGFSTVAFLAYQYLKNKQFQLKNQKIQSRKPSEENSDTESKINESEYKRVAKIVSDVGLKYISIFEESKILEKILPRVFEGQSDLEKICSDLTYDGLDYDAIQKAVSDPVWELLKLKGKRVRPVLCGLFAESLGGKFEDVVEIAGFIEILHNASLIIDDIEDKGETRRGQKAVHKIYGEDVGINAANLAYFLPINYIFKNSKNYTPEQLTKITQIFAEEMIQIHMGQAWDIQWHNHKFANKVYPNEPQYLQMIVYKTGALLRMMIKMICAKLNVKDKHVQEALNEFGILVGAAFQIQDDILSVDVDENDDSQFAKGKGLVGEDIYEGKITLMVVNFLEQANSRDRKKFLAILQANTKNPKLIRQAIGYLNKYGSIQYAKKYAKKLINDAWDKLDSVLPESHVKQQLQAFCMYLICRKK